MLDEVAKRTEAFDAENSVPVVLADGQEWRFVRPWHQIRPVFKGGKVSHAYHAISYSEDVDRLLATIADGQVDTISGAASLAGVGPRP
jgi:hypothetical protein